MSEKRKISGVLFDFDGTLTLPGALDFAAIRADLSCPDNETILEFIQALPAGEARARAHRILEEYELEAAIKAGPNPGAEELVAYLKDRGIPFGIITRNRHWSVSRSLENFRSLRPGDFAVILSRDDVFAPKPDPEGIEEAAKRMGVPLEEVLVVGDFRYDVIAGRRAGAVTVLLTNGRAMEEPGCAPDYQVHSLRELQQLLGEFSGGM